MNYYIQGDKEKADQIKAAFEAKGCVMRTGIQCDLSDMIYYSLNGKVGSIKLRNLDLFKTHPDYKELELPIEPCFKVGDKIEATIYGIKRSVTIREVDKTNRCYFGTLEQCIGFSEQDQWHLAPKPHYDIKNFHAGMPVLVRDDRQEKWCYALYSHHDNEDSYQFVTAGVTPFIQCIPFEGNEHLLGTIEPCDECYINW